MALFDELHTSLLMAFQTVCVLAHRAATSCSGGIVDLPLVEQLVVLVFHVPGLVKAIVADVWRWRRWRRRNLWRRRCLLAGVTFLGSLALARGRGIRRQSLGTLRCQAIDGALQERGADIGLVLGAREEGGLDLLQQPFVVLLIHVAGLVGGGLLNVQPLEQPFVVLLIHVAALGGGGLLPAVRRGIQRRRSSLRNSGTSSGARRVECRGSGRGRGCGI
mmetsp:Transcript_85277/g.275230  ORF Transcript_85277/g.275230 Transcript_85277/m.275230 type:complete len:219 (+) Transcript_85277:887-1543(+)